MQDQEENPEEAEEKPIDEEYPTRMPDGPRETASTTDIEAAHAPKAETRLDTAPEPDPESEPPSPLEGAFLAVDPASVLVERLQGMALVVGIGGPLFFILSLAFLLGNLPAKVYFPLLLPILGVALLLWLWPPLHYRHLRYCADSSGLRIKRGVLWHSDVCIPSSRVQHTDVTQGPMQRHWSLATLTVHTAGTKGASIHLAGLGHEVALELRDRLLPREPPVDHGGDDEPEIDGE